MACGGIRKVLEGGPRVVDAIGNGEIALVLDTTGGARAAVRAMETLLAGGLDAAPPPHSGSAPPARGPRRYSRNRR